jgi:hypothetical protein
MRLSSCARLRIATAIRQSLRSNKTSPFANRIVANAPRLEASPICPMAASCMQIVESTCPRFHPTVLPSNPPDDTSTHPWSAALIAQSSPAQRQRKFETAPSLVRQRQPILTTCDPRGCRAVPQARIAYPRKLSHEASTSSSILFGLTSALKVDGRRVEAIPEKYGSIRDEPRR